MGKARVGFESHRLYKLLVIPAVALSVIFSWLTISFQNKRFCGNASDCVVWSSFYMFFMLNVFLFVALLTFGYLFLFKKKFLRKGFVWVSFLVLSLFYLVGLYLTLNSYTLISGNELIIRNAPLLQPIEETKIKIVDIQKIQREWHLGGVKNFMHCQYIPILVLKNGEEFKMLDYDITPTLESKGIPVVNDSFPGSTLNCP